MKQWITTLILALFAAHASAQIITTLKSYRLNDKPIFPPDQLVQGADGTLYGMSSYTVFKLQPDGSDFTILKQLSVGGLDIFSGRLELSGSTLYAATSQGNGLNGRPLTVFKMNTDGSGYTVLKTGIVLPHVHEAPGIALSGGTLYGWGFKLNTDGTGYTELAGFPAWDFLEDWHLDIQVAGDEIFGTTARDGLYGAGTVFRLNTDGTGYTVLVDIPAEDQSNLEDYLTLAGSTLYGTSFGSTSRVFRVNTDGTGYSVLKDDFSSAGESLSVGPLQHSGGFLYGTTASLTNNRISWAVFKMNTNGSGYTALTRLTVSNNPAAPNWPNAVKVLTVVGGTIYGMAQNPRGFEGLDGRGGALFKMNTDGTGFAVVHEFTLFTVHPDGSRPGPLVVSDGVLYGIDHAENAASRVFKMNIDGTGFTPLNTSGPAPASDLGGPVALRLAISGSTLFGLGGGTGVQDSYRTIFRMNTDGSGHTVLKDFIWPAEPNPPLSSLVVSGSTLYGTTPGVAGNPESGRIFKLNTDGTGYTILHTFSPTSMDAANGEWTNSDGVLGYGELTLSGTILYGTAGLGGRFGGGTVFRMNIDGTGFTVLKHFTLSDPPLGPLLTLSGATLYGSWGRYELVGSVVGAVFRLNTNGTGFSILKQFSALVWDDVLKTYTNSDGAVPHPSLVWGNTLYGTTTAGGKFGSGTVFKINTDGTGFAVMAHNGSSNRPASTTPGFHRLALSGSTLYGAGGGSGDQGAGAIYSISLTPRLSIARKGTNSLAVTWPSIWTDYVLQEKPNGLGSVNWSNVTAAIQNDGTNKALVVNPTNGARFYRLKSQ